MFKVAWVNNMLSHTELKIRIIIVFNHLTPRLRRVRPKQKRYGSSRGLKVIYELLPCTPTAEVHFGSFDVAGGSPNALQRKTACNSITMRSNEKTIFLTKSLCSKIAAMHSQVKKYTLEVSTLQMVALMLFNRRLQFTCIQWDPTRKRYSSQRACAQELLPLSEEVHFGGFDVADGSPNTL